VDRATVTVDEAAKILGCGRAAAYEGVRTGAIPSIRISERCIRISLRVLERILDGDVAPEAVTGGPPPRAAK
jgi:excisionase family DNA binding protein